MAEAAGANLGTATRVWASLLVLTTMPSWAADAPAFHTLPPCRVIDTRGPAGEFGGPALVAEAERRFAVRRRCGLPDNAAAVSYNVTVTQPTEAGDLRVYPGATTAPLASAINYASGQTRGNNGIVPLGSEGGFSVRVDQATGSVHAILDVNGYFTTTDEVATPVGLGVRIRPAPEVEVTFDEVTQAGVTKARVIEFADNRTVDVDQGLKSFFPPGSPPQALLPDVTVPSYLKALGKGTPSGPPTFVLAVIDTTAQFKRTAEFHGFEDFRLGHDPACVNAADRTKEPRTFDVPEAAKGEPSLVEGAVFTDISSGCGSNKGSGWNFSLYLTGRDTRPVLEVARFKLRRMQDTLAALASFITSPAVATSLTNEVQAALSTLDASPLSSLANMNNVVAIGDQNPTAFDNSTRNVAGELLGRAQSATYLLDKVLYAPPGTLTEFPLAVNRAPRGIVRGPDGNVWFTEIDRIGRITPAGAITEFTWGGSPVLQPYLMTLGPDGNLWITEYLLNRIARMTTAGGAVEFPTPTAGSRPEVSWPGPTATSGSPSGPGTRSAASPQRGRSPSSLFPPRPAGPTGSRPPPTTSGSPSRRATG